MARMQRRIASGYNRRHRVYGRLWQSRYKARVIDSDEYYRQALAYAHLNPVAAGVVADPSAYRYSGHAAIIGRAPARLVDVAASLRGFGTQSIESGRIEYQTWVRTVAESKWLAAGLEELPWWVEASDSDEIASSDKHTGAVTFDDLPPVEPPFQLRLDEAIRRFESMTGQSIDVLVSRTRDPEVVCARMVLTSLAVQTHGHRVRDVAAALGRNPGSVSRWLSTVSMKDRDDPTFRRQLESMAENISPKATP